MMNSIDNKLFFSNLPLLLAQFRDTFQLFIDTSSTRRDSEDNKDEAEEDFFENQSAQAVKEEPSPEQSDTEFPSLVRSSNGSSATATLATVNKSAPASTGVCIRTALSMMHQ